MTICRGCGNEAGNSIFTAREMMLGMRTEFQYMECSRCGSLQILQVPQDLGKYYPAGYYSFQKPGALKEYLKHRWASHSYGCSCWVGGLLSRFMGKNPAVAALRRLNLAKNARILDVGCGSGDLLRDLASLGFTDLKGVDPYNEKELRFEDGVVVWKSELKDVQGPFDLIMFHHAFEHVSEPRAVFESVARLLKPGGTLLIRTPVANSFAWRQYKANWVQLDAPRHLFIPSAKFLREAANRFGFSLDAEVYDSTEFQFWGSEQYRNEIPLSDPRSHHRSIVKQLFPSAEIRAFRKQAAELNSKKDGDSAAFYFLK